MLLDRVWDRSCEDCQTWMYDEEPTSRRYGLPMVRGGQQVRQGTPPITPCERCPKILESRKLHAAEVERRGVMPSDAIEPEPLHRAIVDHFLECDAVLSFPPGDWIARHAAIIRPIHDEYKRRMWQATILQIAVAAKR